MLESMEARGVKGRLAFPLTALPRPGEILLAEGSLAAGMEYPSLKLAILTEGQIPDGHTEEEAERLIGEIKAKLDSGATSGAAMRLREKDPALCSLTAGVIHSCIDRGMKRTADILYGEGSPWGSCHRRNPDKWGIPLDDGEIASWFSRHPNIWR